jgi:hypothetical protein
MAVTTNIRWIRPPNWNGETAGYRRIVVHLTGIVSGQAALNETDVVKVNLSEWRTRSGAVPTRTVIEKLRWQIHGLSVTLEWDRTPDEIIAYLNAGVAADSDSGEIDWAKDGGLVDDGEVGTGDILLTTTNGAAGDTYDITITLRLKD